MPASMPVLLRDEHLAAFLKPSGLPVHRGWARDPVTALDLAARTLRTRIYPIHRLDRGTSGVLLFALTSETAGAMQKLFRAGAIAKSYLTLVRDTAPESGLIDYAIPNEQDGPRVDAVTEFKRLWVGDHASLVLAHPRTGRLHQVRRHMKHLRNPVIGDTKYGDGRVNRYHRERYGLDRLALHAWKVAFTHPVTGASVLVIAPLSDDLAQPFGKLGIPADMLGDSGPPGGPA